MLRARKVILQRGVDYFSILHTLELLKTLIISFFCLVYFKKYITFILIIILSFLTFSCMFITGSFVSTNDANFPHF